VLNFLCLNEVDIHWDIQMDLILNMEILKQFSLVEEKALMWKFEQLISLKIVLIHNQLVRYFWETQDNFFEEN
jgi:hypothetical protein